MSSRIQVPVEAIPSGSTLHTYADGTVWLTNASGDWVTLRSIAEAYEAGPELNMRVVSPDLSVELVASVVTPKGGSLRQCPFCHADRIADADGGGRRLSQHVSRDECLTCQRWVAG